MYICLVRYYLKIETMHGSSDTLMSHHFFSDGAVLIVLWVFFLETFEKKNIFQMRDSNPGPPRF